MPVVLLAVLLATAGNTAPCSYTRQPGMLVAGSELRAANYSDLSLAQNWCSSNVLCRGFTFEAAATPPPVGGVLPCFDASPFRGQQITVHFKFGLVEVASQHPWVAVVRTDSVTSVVANTSLGLLRGTRFFPAGCAPPCTAQSLDQYLGIRYAEPMPPDGSGRWRHATPKAAWRGVLDANDYGSACTSQSQVPGRVLFAGKPCEEDCLFLNIWSPSLAEAPLPVLVWIHGGSFLQGSGSDNIDADGPGNGTWIITASNRSLVTVTLNYRLGVFGFLGSNDLRARTPDGSTGNYGQADQRLALRWVRDNIASFGGDPTRVLLMGESAGAGSVSCHLVSPPSFGLFHTAAMSSGAFSAWISSPMVASAPADPTQGAQATFEALVDESKCASANRSTVLACLEAIPAAKLVTFAAVKNAGFGPTIDGVELSDTPMALLRQGQLDRSVRAVLVGSVAEDSNIAVANGRTASAADFGQFMASQYLFTNYVKGNATVIPTMLALYDNWTLAGPTPPLDPAGSFSQWCE